MLGTQPSTIYLGNNTSSGTPVRLLPFKPSPDATNGRGRNLFKALLNSSLSPSDQVGTPYQFSFVVSLFGAIVPGTIYSNSNAGLTLSVAINLGGTISFSVTDINGTSTKTTTQSLQTGWSYKLTFQYTYNGQIGFNRSDFMFIFINGRQASDSIGADGLASVSVALAASTITITASATMAVAWVAQWWYAWWLSFNKSFAWKAWYYWWKAWWYSSWWWYFYYWWWWYVWWDCDLGPCDPPGDCGPNLCHGAAPFDTMYRVERHTGNVNFAVAGQGIRDFNTNTTPAVINITVPGPVIKAYLYWNVIGSFTAVCPDTAVFNGNSGSGNIVGCCGNTCWAAFCVNSGKDSTNQPSQGIFNKVWMRDVTSLVPGTGSYTVSLPGVVPGNFVAYAASDSPRYPGCRGGQGVALVVIYETPPQVVTRPRQRCCVPIPGQTVTETLTNEIILWHGAKLLKCDGCNPPTIGGSNDYTISWKTKHTWNPKICTVVGDAQSKYNDSFFWNGIQLPPQPSYFNPNAGNLLHIKTEYLPAHTAKCDCGSSQENSVRAFTPDDCLCWFVFIYFGQQKCIRPAATSPPLSFTSPPTPPMTLWNPNPPDCCPLKLPCCGDVCLPTKLNIGITAPTLACSCFATQGYTMNWNKSENKYILKPTAGVCGCTLFGWLYCQGTQWVLYLALSEGSTVCSDGVNAAFPINCSPFGGVGTVELTAENLCSCGCVIDSLQVNVSPG